MNSRPLPLAAWWLLALVPGNALIALELNAGLFRPGTWVLRFMPALTVLALVLFTQLVTTPRAIRLRKELHLALVPGLAALLISALPLLFDAVPADSGARELFVSSSFALSLFTPAGVVLWLFATEFRNQTLALLLVQPGGRRALVEKFAVAAFLVVISWLQFSAGFDAHSTQWQAALAAHVLALTTCLLWWALTRNTTFTLLASCVPALLPVVVPELASAVALSLYAAVMLALTRRGFSHLPHAEAPLSGVGRSWLGARKWAVELEPQRMLLALPALGTLGFIAFAREADNGKAVAGMLSFICSAAGALLSPGIAFSEARRAGTLDALLAVLPRRRVFVQKLVVSAATVAVTCVALPVVLQRTLGTFEPSAALTWTLAMAFCFAVGLVVSLSSSHAGVTLLVGAGAVVVLSVTQVGLSELAVVAATQKFMPGELLVASFAGTTALLFGLAWLLFDDARRPARLLSAGAAVCVAQAVVLGVVGSLLPH